MTSKRSTLGAYDLGMGDSSVRIEDAGDLRVRQAMIARPKSLPRSAGVGEARALFANPKNRLLPVTEDGIYCGHVLRDDVPESVPDEAPLEPHVRRDCPQIGPDESVAAALPLATDAFDNRIVVVGGRRAARGPALPQQARRLPVRGRARVSEVYRSELTPVAFLQRAAYIHPARVAVAHEDGRRLTYGALEERSNRLANALRARGLQHGDRVAVLSPNAPAILEAHYAVPLAGGVLVAINTRLGAA